MAAMVRVMMEESCIVASLEVVQDKCFEWRIIFEVELRRRID